MGNKTFKTIKNNSNSKNIWFKCIREKLFIIYPGKWISNLFGVLHKLSQGGFMSYTETKDRKGSGVFNQRKFKGGLNI